MLLNVAARILGFILRIDHRLDRPFHTIVVCKYKGMGSIVQSTPLLKTLRQAYPDSRIIFVSSSANYELLSQIDIVDQVYTVDDSSFGNLARTLPGFVFQLWRERPQLFLDLEIYSHFSSILATMSCATNRVGFYKSSKQYRMGMYTHMMFFNIKAPISQAYLQMARLLGIRQTDQSLYRFAVPGTVRASLSKKLAQLHGFKDAPYIVVNPNASELRLERRWPPPKFADLISRLSEEHPVILIGSPAECPYVQAIYEQVPDGKQVSNTAGLITIPELMALISQAKMVITNDTGPMHLSFAFGKLTLALFGPCHPEQYGIRENCYYIYKNVYCSPCVHEFDLPPCLGDNQCMKQIAVDEVYAMAKDLLTGKQPAASEERIKYRNQNGDEPLGKVLRS
jgi:ADP-heptose:LPS heptosyltransferase